MNMLKEAGRKTKNKTMSRDITHNNQIKGINDTGNQKQRDEWKEGVRACDGCCCLYGSVEMSGSARESQRLGTNKLHHSPSVQQHSAF